MKYNYIEILVFFFISSVLFGIILMIPLEYAWPMILLFLYATTETLEIKGEENEED